MIVIAASNTKVLTIPKEVASRFIVICFFVSPAYLTIFRSFSARTGNTHGIRFKIRPPINANNIIICSGSFEVELELLPPH